ncbi:CDGSH iron-sulfur domain-containing protein [Plantactinospora sonchi]|uniref:CDGSH iron-sulfur domain-containing protein n=1 Tax=Plantactinospora sonchi TaxID=1544735 RepID=A0ABU7RMF2_9ACTN
MTVTPYEDGPLLIRGDFLLRTPDGEIIEAGRDTVALCRCGRSGIKPFCDGSHRVVGFRAGAAPDPTPAGECRLRPATGPRRTGPDG